MENTLEPMRNDIYTNGTTIAVVHSVPSETVEAWVRAVRGWSQVNDVDWHWFGGRGRIAALGNENELARVREACKYLLPALHTMLPELYPMLYAPEIDRAPSAGYIVQP